MTRKLPFREYWHRRIAAVREPADRMNRTFDYLRSVISHAPPHVARRAAADITVTIRRYADDLEATLQREGK